MFSPQKNSLFSQIKTGMVLIYREQDESRKKELETKFKNESFPNFVKNLENILEARGGKHFAGNEVCF